MTRPLAIDLFCGLGGWTEGLLAEGYDVIGFDLERHEYAVPEIMSNTDDGSKGTRPVAKRGWTQGCAVSLGMEGANNQPRTRILRYPAQLVIQDVLTLHGSQFRDAALIVASPPCQAYSYRAMPWKRAKALPPPDNSLFEACFRIQREACAAAGRHIPLIVENVRGAQKWVGRARWNFGSFYLWGDVPALMPMTMRGVKVGGLDWKHPDDPRHRPGQAFNTTAEAGLKNAGFRFDGSGRSFQSESVKNSGGSWFNIAHNTTSGKGNNSDGRKAPAGTQWFNDGPRTSDSLASSGSKSPARKAASAMIAKIPLPLSWWIAATFHPARTRSVA